MRIKLICIENGSCYKASDTVFYVNINQVYYSVRANKAGYDRPPPGELYRIEDENGLYMGLVNKKNFMKFGDFRQMRIDKILEE
jgi:hypothetical protein